MKQSHASDEAKKLAQDLSWMEFKPSGTWIPVSQMHDEIVIKGNFEEVYKSVAEHMKEVSDIMKELPSGRHITQSKYNAGKYHAWRSDEQLRKIGGAVYKDKFNNEVVVSEVTEKQEYTSNWKDVEYLGKVDTFIKKIEPTMELFPTRFGNNTIKELEQIPGWDIIHVNGNASYLYEGIIVSASWPGTQYKQIANVKLPNGVEFIWKAESMKGILDFIKKEFA